MKKSLIFAVGMLFATTAFVGCTDEEVVHSSNVLNVEAAVGVQSRTTLADDFRTVTWCEDDLIYLFGDGADATMHLIAGAGTEVGTFTGTVNGFPNKLTKALYPVPTIENGVYSYDLLADRDYSKNSAAPLFGPFIDGKIQYNNLVAMVRIPLSASNQERELVLDMEGISGKLIVDVENGTAEMETSATNVVNVTIPAGDACYIDIPVPAKDYKNGYKITLDGVTLAEKNSSVDLKDPDIVLVVLNEPSTENPDTGSSIKADHYITSFSDLLWVANQVNAGNTFSGKTLAMTEDIDLNGIQWIPIGNSTNSFQGTFDGCNHKISNLTIDGGNQSNQGLFGMTTNGEIKNLVIENAKVNGRLNVGVVAGTPYTSRYTNITVQGKVEVNGMAYVGGVGGKNAYADWTDITVNVEEGSYVKANSVENGIAYRTYVGGVIGFMGEGGHTFTNVKSNIDVIGSTIDVGGITGIAHYNNNFKNCSSSGNVEIISASDAAEAEEIGGIAGVWHNQNGQTVTFKGCSFTGTLKANITEGVDLSDNTITGKAYSTTGTGQLIIDGTLSVVVNSETSFAEVIAKAGAAGAGNTNITITKNLDFTGIDWTPIKVDGYHGADIVTLDGNGTIITGLTAPLFAGGFAGGSGIVIKNLTIDQSAIVSKNTLGSGAFIESVDSMDKIWLENCHVKNSTITGGAGSRTGGLIGWTAGYSNVTDGPVKTYVTIEDCSVINCTITCDGSVGGIYGHAGNNDWTYSTVKNCTVKDCNLISTDDGGWRVGVVVGTANVGEVTISNITESGNTLTQTGKTAPEGQSNLYGRFVPGTTGKLTIDGVNI